MATTTSSTTTTATTKVKAEVASDEESAFSAFIPSKTNENGKFNKDKSKLCVTCGEAFVTAEELVVHFRSKCSASAASILSVTSAPASAFPSLVAQKELSLSPLPPTPSPAAISNLRNDKIAIGGGGGGVLGGARFDPTTHRNSLTPILLPVAMHDDEPASIRIVGPAQMVLPVAVGRHTDLTSTPLVLQEQMSCGVSLPAKLRINDDLCLPVQIEASANKPSTSRRPTVLKRKRDMGACEETGPLDLSLKTPRTILDAALSPTTALTAFLQQLPSTSFAALSCERKFKCSCGIEFANETTFNGHKNFYCRLRPSAEEDAVRQVTPKVPEQCAQCDFQPTSASQLNQHIRQQHSVVKTYICSQCGYKGYSLRGIRGHLREHLSPQLFAHPAYEPLLAQFYKEVSGNGHSVATKAFPCSKCHASFASQELAGSHVCTAPAPS